MYIRIEQKIICSKCGSTDYESFSDSRFKGIRCKKCGHEKKDLHDHLRQAEGNRFWVSGRVEAKEIKF